MVTVETLNKVIPVLLVAIIAVGVVTGYFYHEAEANKMFAPLAVAFVLVFAMYWCIQKRSELVAGKKVDKY